MSHAVIDAVEDALMRAGMRHLEPALVDDERVRIAPRDPAWRSYRVDGMPDADELLERLESLDAELQPIIRPDGEGWVLGSGYLGDRRFERDAVPEMIRHLMDAHLLPYFARPVLAFQVQETDEGHALAVVTLERD